MAIIVFILVFLILCNRLWFVAVVTSLSRDKKVVEVVKNHKIIDFVYQKTGLKLASIRVVDTDRVWGFMGGIGRMSYMVISRDAYENFSKDELEWLLLHEAGHNRLWHSTKYILLQLAFLASGIWVLHFLTLGLGAFVMAILLGFIFGISYIQIARRFEYEANAFAIARMDHPKAVATLYDKAKKKWNRMNRREGLVHTLFNIWNLQIYQDMIATANR